MLPAQHPTALQVHRPICKFNAISTIRLSERLYQRNGHRRSNATALSSRTTLNWTGLHRIGRARAAFYATKPMGQKSKPCWKHSTKPNSKIFRWTRTTRSKCRPWREAENRALLRMHHAICHDPHHKFYQYSGAISAPTTRTWLKCIFKSSPNGTVRSAGIVCIWCDCHRISAWIANICPISQNWTLARITTCTRPRIRWAVRTLPKRFPAICFKMRSFWAMATA